MSSIALADEPFARGIGPVTVGPDPDCDHPTITAGINAQLDNGEVQVMSGSYDERMILGSKSLQIVGGYPDCSGIGTPSGRSIVDRNGSGLGVDVFYPAAVADPARNIVIENFEIREGGGSGFDSGGMVVEGRPGRLAVSLRNVLITDNSRSGTSGDGGGIRIITTGDRSGNLTFVSFDNDSQIVSNTASGDGGGMYCRSTHDVGDLDDLIVFGTTLIFDNQATNGGGISVDGCERITMFNGGPIVLIFPSGGIVNNTATERGGGLHVVNGGEVRMFSGQFAGFGDPGEAALLAGNSASSGGAAWVSGLNSVVALSNTYVINNTADSLGGAFYVDNSAALSMRRSGGIGPCDPPQSGGGVLSRPPCSVLEGNEAAGGGGVWVTGSSMAEIDRTFIRANIGGLSGGAIGYAGNLTIDDGPSSVLEIESSVLAGNEGGRALYATSSGLIRVVHSTLYDHVGTWGRATSAAGKSATIAVLSSILFEPGTSAPLFDFLGDGTQTVRFDCVLSNRPATDWGGTAITTASAEIDPQFRDPANGDFRLRDRSPAIDYCDDFATPQVDGLGGTPRGTAWIGPDPIPAPPVSIPDGTYDVGAFEMVFETRTADLGIEIVDPDLFIDAGQNFVSYTLRITNNGPETAFGPIDVFDDVTAGAVTNRSWSCSPGPGVSCTPSSGSGDVTTELSDMQPGDVVLISVNQELVDTSVDSVFQYIGAVVPSGFNLDLNGANDFDEIEVRIGVFADGFEALPVLP